MKKKLLSIAIILSMGATFLTPITAHASTHTWEAVGSAGFSADQAFATKIATDRSGTPYVAYGDNANGGKATVMKYDGSNWTTVGSPDFSAHAINGNTDIAIAIDSSGTPYVAYGDWISSSSYPVVVMKYTGNGSTGWEEVGNGNVSASSGEYVSMAIGADDKPYVVYTDNTNTGKATVMKYDGTNWLPVGNQEFSAGQTAYNSIAMDGNTPYVAYQDYGNGNSGATVMKYDGSSWVTVGTENFSISYADQISIAIGTDGNPYVAYADEDDYYGNGYGAAAVMKYTGQGSTGWEAVGNAGASGDSVNDLSMAVGGNGKPYFEYLDSEAYPHVMKYNGSSWEIAGNPGFSAGNAQDTSMVIGADGNPYIAYVDYGNSQKATVMKLEEDKEVTSVDSLTDKTVANGTDENSIGLPNTIDITLSDGSTTSAAVTWDNGSPTYDGYTIGTYTFTGTLILPDGVVNSNNYTASVDVIVQAVNNETTPAAVTVDGVDSLDDITVSNGTNKSDIDLSDTIDITLSDGTTTSAAVTWDNGTPTYDGDVAGTYTFTGTLTLPDGVTNPNNYKVRVRVIVQAAVTVASSSSHHHHSSTTITSTKTETKKSDDNSIKDTGSKMKGWKLIDNKWHFFNNKSGEMVTGWYKSEAGDWTYDQKDILGQWFHLGTDGKMDTGWFKDTDGNWYYLCDGRDYGALGYMETGWKYINSNWYYFNSNGSMANKTVVDGYTLGSDGALVE